MDAQQAVRHIDDLITNEHMHAVPKDDRGYALKVGPYIDRVEDAIRALGVALSVSFDAAMLIAIGTIIDRNKSS